MALHYTLHLEKDEQPICTYYAPQDAIQSAQKQAYITEKDIWLQFPDGSWRVFSKAELSYSEKAPKI